MDMVEVPLKMASTSRDGAIMYKTLGFVFCGPVSCMTTTIWQTESTEIISKEIASHTPAQVDSMDAGTWFVPGRCVGKKYCFSILGPLELPCAVGI